MLIVILFILLYLFSIFYLKGKIGTQNKIVLVICVMLTIMIGSRNPFIWPDTYGYVLTFLEMGTGDPLDLYYGFTAYHESGYLLLTYLVRLFTDNGQVYLTVMAGLSLFVLYKALSKYCVLPLLGLCVYIARFIIGRDCIQMRSSLAIFLIIWGLKYVYERKIWHYIAIIYFASFFHRMAYIALPFYFFGLIKWDKQKITWSLIAAFVLSQTMADSISGWVDDFSDDFNYGTYTQGHYVEAAKGLWNPMIYWQIGVLYVYMHYERLLAYSSKYYYLFRAGYLYSTLILILFCNYTALSGRTSTIFATLEIFMLALIVKKISPNERAIYFLVLGVALLYFFISKYNSVIYILSFVI